MNTTCVTVPTLRVFDLSHGCGPRIDLLEASVSDARGWCDTEHASLDVESRGCSWSPVYFQEHPLNSVTKLTRTIHAHILL